MCLPTREEYNAFLAFDHNWREQTGAISRDRWATVNSCWENRAWSYVNLAESEHNREIFKPCLGNCDPCGSPYCNCSRKALAQFWKAFYARQAVHSHLKLIFVENK